jgi:predicted O-linked N-acetylglucosamine transferase (SPINDLY family)
MAQIAPLTQTEVEQENGTKAFLQELAKLKTWFRAQPSLDGSEAVGAQQPYYLAYHEANHRSALGDYGSLCSSLMAGWARKAGLSTPVRRRPPKWRVGIVSAHVHSHSVWHALIRGWIEHLDPARFELDVFHTGRTRDAETEWAARRVSRLHHGARDWKAWARVVTESSIDVLLYPELGMDATTIKLASLRLAQLQLASWGHPITSGLPTIDGYVSAQAFEPSDAADHYTERLILLPRLGCCYRPYGTRPAAVDFNAMGIGKDDKVLLCAGTPFKYTPRHDAVLVDIARRCNPCKLVFFRNPSSSLADLLQQRLQAAFDAAGLPSADMLRFVPWQAQAEFFGFLDRADAYLDSLGFSGFNTAMQAVERGTPIVAFEGRFMRGRFASAILRQAGLDEWVADTPQGFIDRVTRLVSSGAERAAVSSQLAASRTALWDDSAGVAEFGNHIAQLLRSQDVPAHGGS